MDELPLPPLPDRDPKGHKGTFGTVAILGGCASTRPGTMRMIGAPVLSARGALRAGAGLVRLLMPAPILDVGVAMLPSATGVSLAVDELGDVVNHLAATELDRQIATSSVMVLGPGLGQGAHGTGGCAALVLRALQQEEIPVVLDADGLNLLSGITEFWRDLRAQLILTPHPGEYRRLALAVGVEGDPVDDAARPRAAEMLAQRLGAIVVLKGAGTVVSDGHRTWICRRGHACMATGGTGDVLAGIIAGLIAQFARGNGESAVLAKIPEKFRAAMAALHEKVQVSKGAPAGNGRPTLDLFECARWGVELHGLAGERWARENGEAGLLAHELADLLPVVMEEVRRSR